MNWEHRSILREELLRSIAWLGLGMVGWPILATELAWLEPSVLTVVVFPLLTWAALTATFVGLRIAATGDMQVTSPEGLSTSLVLGIMLGGVGAVYLVALQGYAALWVTTGYVAVTLAAIAWHWYVRLPETRPGSPV